MPEVQTHLVVSRWARTTIELETSMSVAAVGKLADVVHGPEDQGATIASGSFRTDGMVIVPCSMKTLAGIRTGYAEGLVCRAADVVLKERRKLVLVPRETPLSEIHLENMLELARKGVQIVPPMPAFYNHPKSVNDIVEHLVVRILVQHQHDADLRVVDGGVVAQRHVDLGRRGAGLDDARRDAVQRDGDPADLRHRFVGFGYRHGRSRWVGLAAAALADGGGARAGGRRLADGGRNAPALCVLVEHAATAMVVATVAVVIGASLVSLVVRPSLLR